VRKPAVRITRALALLVAVLLCASAFAPAQSTPGLDTLARALTQQLSARQFSSVASHFDADMSSAMSSLQLANAWDSIVGQAGAFQSIIATHTNEQQHYQTVFVTSKFAKASLDLKWVFDSKGFVAGFFVVPASTAASIEWAPPFYAKPANFHEQPLTVGDAPWQLSGTLTLPNGPGPFPAVVLVAGSGPEDQDETIANNKPFKDLAWGLASRNIAVLRYNKRTLQYGKEMAAQSKGFTVNDESVGDARAAVALLAKQPGIDPKRIFVLGHSLGGMMAPRIAQDDAQVAGLVILAGPTRPFELVVVDQLKYIASLNGKITPEAQKQIDAAEKDAKEIESPTLAADAKVNLLGSPVPGSYFLDLRGYHPAEVAASLKIPILILQGDRDYQVTVAEDLAGWKQALSSKPSVTFKIYPGLYHLFMPSAATGSGLGTPADYEKSGHVTINVVDDIATWITVQPKSAKISTAVGVVPNSSK
jgi:dienelactone hydrolase